MFKLNGMYSLAMWRFCCSCSCASCLRDLFSLILSGLRGLVGCVEVKLVPKCTVTCPDNPIVLVRSEEKERGGHGSYLGSGLPKMLVSVKGTNGILVALMGNEVNMSLIDTGMTDGRCGNSHSHTNHRHFGAVGLTGVRHEKALCKYYLCIYYSSNVLGRTYL
jgi:hypothetical protein